jgi:acetyltransferase-like isoleucine patch superfamily enzyme
MSRVRLIVGVLVALLPSWMKILVYRHFYGYRIGRGVRIGLSPFIGVKRCRIGDHVRIGWGNLFYGIQDLAIGDHTRIGLLNLFRGGLRIEIGSYSTILRQNVCNSIVGADFIHPVDSVLVLGNGVSLSSGHWLDFSAGITLGDHVIVGGRNSSFWTHNRQRGRSITIGRHCYLGSEIRVAPGVEVAPYCIVALGSVLTGRYCADRSLVGGNPAVVVRSLEDRDLFLITNKTRSDIPDDLVRAALSESFDATIPRA